MRFKICVALSTFIMATVCTLVASAETTAANLILTPPGKNNTVEITLTATALGNDISDTDTTTASGNMPVKLGVEYNPLTQEVTSVDGIEFTGGAVAFTDMSFTLDFGLLLGKINASGKGIAATLDTPVPPGPVNDNEFSTLDHIVLVNKGAFEASGTGLVGALFDPMTLDLEAEPIEATADSTGQIEVSLMEVIGDTATYEVTLLLPLEFNETVLEDGDITVKVTGTGTFEAVGTYTREIPRNAAPTADPGADQTVECDCDSPQGTRVTLDGSGSDDADGDDLTYTWNGPFEGSPVKGVEPTVILVDGCAGQYTIRLIVNDGTINSEPDTVVITVTDTSPPVPVCPGDQTVSANPDTGTAPISMIELPEEAQDACDGIILVEHDAPEVFPEGVTRVTVTAEDAEGNTATCSFEVTVTAGGVFIRGDGNGDGQVNISDASFMLNFLFLGGPDLPCQAAGDPNGDGAVNISDSSYLLNFLFLGGPEPVQPFPDCGPLAEDETLDCEVSTATCP